MEKSIHQFSVGAFSCRVLKEGARQSTVTENIGGASEADILAMLAKIDFPNEVEVGFNNLLIDTGNHKVLVDTGFGDGVLLSNLASIGLTPDNIDILIITHGDGDHIGGLLTPDGNSAFPKATIYLWENSWDLWTSEIGRANMVKEFIKLMDRRGLNEPQKTEMGANRAKYGAETLLKIRDQVIRVPVNEEIIPGIQLVPAPGHRSDHTGLLVESNGEALLHVVDSIRHPIQMANPNLYSYIDSYGDVVAKTNRKLLKLAIEKNAILFGAHLTFPAIGRVTKKGEDWWAWEALA
jgi:glyoxylase-like metal-dependent hydrolase (beta-lactamase superfamily II)